MEKLKKALPFIFPPLAVLLIMGFAFYRHGLYPFGDGTVSWCDMSQQVIPLDTSAHRLQGYFYRQGRNVP